MNAELIFTILIMGFIGYTVIGWLIDKTRETMRQKAGSDNSNTFYGSGQYSEFSSEKSEEHWSQVLEVDRAASIESIKTAYRSKIRQYHPDKVSSLGREFQEIAEQKSKQINAAYETAKSDRKFS